VRGARRSWIASLLGSVVLCGCGYRPLYSGKPPEERLSVVASRIGIPRAEAVQSALRGARQELAAAGALSTSSDRYPRLVLELVRVDETATGVVAVGAEGDALPQARGSSVAVTGRAWIEARPGERSDETPDLHRVESVASGASSGLDREQNRAAVEAAANRLGRDLARLVLGLPTPRRE